MNRRYGIEILGIVLALAPLVRGLAAEVPIEVRQAELEFSKGNWDAGHSLCDAVLSSAQGAQWADYIQFLEIKGRLDAGDAATFESQYAALEQNQPNYPYLPKLTVILGNEKLKSGSFQEAESILKRAALRFRPQPEADEARLSLLRHYWKEDRYQDYLATAAEVAPAVPGSDGGEVSYRSGLIILRLQADAVRARGLFDEAARSNGAYSREAQAASDWVSILLRAREADCSDQEIADRFQQWTVETQGGSESLLNPHDTARRTLNFAVAVYPDAPQVARRLALAISNDPVYGQFAIQAKYQAAQWAGENLSTIRPLVEAETTAQESMRQALEQSKQGNTDQALQVLDQLILQWPRTATARDAYLRKGYCLIVGRRSEEAAQAFERALQANADLGPSHPFNLEARCRLFNLRHAGYYALAKGPYDDPSVHAENLPALDRASQICDEWIQTIPAQGPDSEKAQLEKGGLLFEAARSGKDHERWNAVRKFLNDSVLQHEEYTTPTRAVAQLMILETYFHERNWKETVRLSALFAQTFPGSWREIGTASVFEYSALKALGETEASRAVLKRMTDDIPIDAPFFPTMNYHCIGYVARAQIAQKEGNQAIADALAKYAKTRFPDDPFWAP